MLAAEDMLKQAFMLCLAMTPAACGPAASSGGFDSPNPAAKMYAIEHAVRNNELDAVPRIVEQLDSDDPAVRMLAIAALKRMTGQTHGYCEYDPPEVRRQAIARWEQSLTQQ